MAKILVAEEDGDICVFFSKLLSHNNHFVKMASTRSELLNAVEFFRPDLILLSVLLAGDHDHQVCKEIKNLHRHIKIILLSLTKESVENVAEYGADGVLENPFYIKNILPCINNILVPEPVEKIKEFKSLLPPKLVYHNNYQRPISHTQKHIKNSTKKNIQGSSPGLPGRIL